jgi:urease accessory protein
MSGDLQLLRILHLASPALPIGGFHFSQGLEYAVHRNWVCSEATALEWISGLAESALGSLDLPVLARLHEAWTHNDSVAVLRWNAWLLAARETEELRAEDRHMGAALRKVLSELEVTQGAESAACDACYATMFAFACAQWKVPVTDTLEAYAWTWAENQVLASIKLVPLGQSAGQRILHQLIPLIQRISIRALSLDERDVGTSSVMQAMASAQHETQYTRLFRS